MYRDEDDGLWKFVVVCAAAIVIVIGGAILITTHINNVRTKQCTDAFGSGYIYRNASNGPDCIGKNGEGKYLQHVRTF